MPIRQPVNPSGQNNSYSLRIFLLWAGITAFIILILFRMYSLQVASHDYYAALAANQHEFENEILPARGEIYLNSFGDQRPILAATNVTKFTVYAVPREITQPANTASKLAAVLGEEIVVDELKDQLSGTGSYTPVMREVDEEIVNQIKQMGLTGIYADPETVRYYPENSLASHVLGFLGYRGDQRVGQYGIEGNFEEALAGTKGVIGMEQDGAGRWITVASRNFVPARDGDDIYLTLDSAIQYKAEEVLKRTVEQHHAAQGSVVVADPKTGAILAMASYPDFNPNSYNEVSDIGVYTNTALTKDYEPGSVFKPLTMAAGINEGKVTPDTTYEDMGFVEMEEFRIKNSDGEAHGVQTMTQVLEKSLNTGMIFVQQQIGNDTFREYVERFGFGQKTGIELPNQVLGNLDNLQKKSDIFFATPSYGQGITVTPIQLIQAFTALANGGKMMQPYVVDRVVSADGKEEKTEPEQVGTPIDSRTAAQVSAMMVNVVENGHGTRAAVPGYYIAGKTGTAQVAYTDRAGYDPSKTIGSFIGYGPVDDPRFLMLVRIDDPEEVRFAESTAAPAFGEIAAFILSYLQVPPSR